MNLEKNPNDGRQLLRKWLIGDANRKDELSLEEYSKDDPFLAEAYEGFQSNPENNHTADLTQLKAKLRKKTATQKSGNIGLRIAAALAFLIVALIGLKQWSDSDLAVKETCLLYTSPSPRDS